MPIYLFVPCLVADRRVPGIFDSKPSNQQLTRLPRDQLARLIAACKERWTYSSLFFVIFPSFWRRFIKARGFVYIDFNKIGIQLGYNSVEFFFCTFWFFWFFIKIIVLVIINSLILHTCIYFILFVKFIY